MSTCPICQMSRESPDDIAIHLLDNHGVVYELVKLWLRDQVEKGTYANC